MQGRQGKKEGGGVQRRGSANRQQKINFGPPWKTRGELKGGEGEMGRWACSRSETVRERKSGWVIGMLGRRRAMPRWGNDLVRKSDILRRIQGPPRWYDEPVWWIWRGLGNLEGLGSIHNNKQQSLGFEQSLTEAWKIHLIIRSHCSPPETD